MWQGNIGACQSLVEFRACDGRSSPERGNAVSGIGSAIRSLGLALSGRTLEPFALPAPSRPLWVIGDVHGYAHLLERLLVQIAARTPRHKVDIVLAGDYVDRGPDSAAVLSLVHELSQTDPHITCLLGNHEEMMMAFLDDPIMNCRRWLRHGGYETLRSYGIRAEGIVDWNAGMRDVAARLRDAIGPDILTWLSERPLQWSSGNVYVVHAGMDPVCAPAEQTRHTQLWGHPAFFTTPRSDGIWVVHGHSIVDRPGISGRGRIAVDTGVFQSQRLTGVLITPDGGVTPYSS